MRVFESEVLQAEAALHLLTGERTKAREHVERAIAAAVTSGAPVSAVAGWHQMARLGRASEAVDPLKGLAAIVEGPRVRACVRHAEGLAADDGAELDAAAAEFAAMGYWATAAESALAAAESHQRAGRRGSRIASLAVVQDQAERCGQHRRRRLSSRHRRSRAVDADRPGARGRAPGGARPDQPPDR